MPTETSDTTQARGTTVLHLVAAAALAGLAAAVRDDPSDPHLRRLATALAASLERGAIDTAAADHLLIHRLAGEVERLSQRLYRLDDDVTAHEDRHADLDSQR